MKKIDLSAWPVLMVSSRLENKNAEGNWLRSIIHHLTREQGCRVITSLSIYDTVEIILSRQDLGTIVLDWETEPGFPPGFRPGILPGSDAVDPSGLVPSKKVAQHLACSDDRDVPEKLLTLIRQRNAQLPILIMTRRQSVEDFDDGVFSKISGLIWKLSDTSQFLAGRIEKHVTAYANRVLPPFFHELVTYVNDYKYAWHTPGHMGGEGFLKSPSGVAFHKFFGEDVLRADLSISAPELGSLLDHSGVTGEAENFSARVFGADQTYNVLNGTSTANQIIWRSRMLPGEHSIVDRNCHKSLNYAMVITGAAPQYMVPLRNKLGIIGPVDFSALRKVREPDTQLPHHLITVHCMVHIIRREFREQRILSLSHDNANRENQTGNGAYQSCLFHLRNLPNNS